MKIRIIGGDRLVLASDGLRVIVWPSGSLHNLEYHQAQPLVDAGWAELDDVPLGGTEQKVVTPDEPRKRRR